MKHALLQQFQKLRNHLSPDVLVFIVLISALLGSVLYLLTPQPVLTITLPEPVPITTEASEPPSEALAVASVAEESEATSKPKKRAKKRYPSYHKKDLKHLAPVSLNRGSRADFQKLPGVGEKMAQRILDYRKTIGQFSRIEDIMGVKGIGEKKFAKMKPYLKL